ncbi:MAG: AN1-type zinc finger domain-containing protein [Candidatus Bathyarchaeia archaeon]
MALSIYQGIHINDKNENITADRKFKMNCQKCQKEVFLPFRCPYCGGYFCTEHRLPENHECIGMESARAPRKEPQTVVVRGQTPYEYTFAYSPTKLAKGTIHFSAKEAKHLTIAALLVMGIGFSIGILPNIYEKLESPLMLAAFSTVLTASFLLHEIAHKLNAQRNNLWAEFRLTFIGAILTLISMLPIFFKIISPGAVVVAGFADRKSVGKISLAGPLTNIVLSTLFSLLWLLYPNPIFLMGAAFNAWIALFNLIPFGMLDGFKIFLWDKRVWVAAFAVSLVLTLISYRIIF